MKFTFTPHALEEIQEREIPIQIIMIVLDHPEQVVSEKKGRSGYQSEVVINDKPYLLRLIVEPDGTVITIYRTSKIRKYGSSS